MKQHIFYLARATLFTLLILINVGSMQAQVSWQQRVNYKIEATLDTNDHVLRGSYALEYTNNSPFVLDSLVMHLWANAYSAPGTPLSQNLVRDGNKEWFFQKAENRGYIDSLKFQQNGVELVVDSLDPYGEMIILRLEHPLVPGETTTLRSPFKLKLPNFVSRMGFRGCEMHFCQWYPKPAVFDHKGWHPMPYLNQGEFYSEFGRFEVLLDLPENIVLASSGNDQSDAIPDQARGFNLNTLPKGYRRHFMVADDVHDFAWFASPLFIKASDSIRTADGSVAIEVYLNPAMQDYHFKALEFAKRSILFLSEEIAPYPYDVFRVVIGNIGAGGGMEYPNIVLIDEFKQEKILDMVIAHEAGHQWFYGILGSNERKHPWMDEGVNSFYEAKYKRKFYPTDEKAQKILEWLGFAAEEEDYLTYAFMAHQGNSQSMGLPADSVSSLYYGAGVYKEASVCMSYLEDYLGEDLFDKALRDYYHRWKFHHPWPDDMQASFERSTQKDLSWFFENLMATNNTLDYAFTKIKRSSDSLYEVSIANKGNVPGPLNIGIFDREGDLKGNYRTEGFYKKKSFFIPARKGDVLVLDPGHRWPEYNRNNNRLNTSALFKKYEKPLLQIGVGLDRPNRSELYWLPAFGYNKYDGNLLGLMFYNSTVPSKNTELFIMPLYGFESKEINGHAWIKHFIFPDDGWIRKVNLGAEVKRYNYAISPRELLSGPDSSTAMQERRAFAVIRPEIVFELRPQSYVSGYKQEIGLSSSIVQNEVLRFETDSPNYFTGKDRYHYAIQELYWKVSKSRVINPWSLRLGLQQGFENDEAAAQLPGSFLKLDAQANVRIDYSGKGKGLDIRLFGGTFLIRKFEKYRKSLADYRLFAHGGQDDYNFSETFVGRTEQDGFWSRQIHEEDGALKLSTPWRGSGALGRNNQFMLATNISSTLPGKIPLRIFADAAYYTNSSLASSSTSVAYAAGLSIHLLGDILKVHAPLFVSSNIENEFLGRKWHDRIRFSIDFRQLNAFRQLREISF